MEQLNYNPDIERQHANDQITMLNKDQIAAYNIIMNSVKNDLGGMFFLQGATGTGKTFIYNVICSRG